MRGRRRLTAAIAASAVAFAGPLACAPGGGRLATVEANPQTSADLDATAELSARLAAQIDAAASAVAEIQAAAAAVADQSRRTTEQTQSGGGLNLAKTDNSTADKWLARILAAGLAVCLGLALLALRYGYDWGRARRQRRENCASVPPAAPMSPPSANAKW